MGENNNVVHRICNKQKGCTAQGRKLDHLYDAIARCAVYLHLQRQIWKSIPKDTKNFYYSETKRGTAPDEFYIQQKAERISFWEIRSALFLLFLKLLQTFDFQMRIQICIGVKIAYITCIGGIVSRLHHIFAPLDII